ncbi:periplasmic fimbrial chaperone [Buttiauxella ferragutiae ATCC 51602]|uniref:Periplasmic fimbrial chaperone n=2 Tax=Enterobacteriaceae TaxID=543 RepID=A0ABX2W674_9ENTR|nr:periplasmic fimbrial chaperone [Buttiauxella ferragutiae ATCC 51602]TDN54410.1 chaperone protein PapD [Buttiauxella sp. JUb87]
MNTMMKTTAVVGLCLSTLSGAHAAISLDRTRVIFNGGDKSMTLNIANDNKQLPYLAQAWLEDARQTKITTGPIVVTPPVQRLEPGVKSLLRLSTTPDIAKLPQDRESLFYFNLREIPPRSEKANSLQIALQTRVKLFYRPASIKTKPNAVWQDKLVLTKESGGYRIENPTPYFITVIGIGEGAKQTQVGKFEAVMLAPKSSQSVKAGNYNAPVLTYINDYGGRPSLTFQCSSNRCTAVETDK